MRRLTAQSSTRAGNPYFAFVGACLFLFAHITDATSLSKASADSYQFPELFAVQPEATKPDYEDFREVVSGSWSIDWEGKWGPDGNNRVSISIRIQRREDAEKARLWNPVVASTRKRIWASIGEPVPDLNARKSRGGTGPPKMGALVGNDRILVNEKSRILFVNGRSWDAAEPLINFMGGALYHDRYSITFEIGFHGRYHPYSEEFARGNLLKLESMVRDAADWWGTSKMSSSKENELRVRLYPALPSVSTLPEGSANNDFRPHFRQNKPFGVLVAAEKPEVAFGTKVWTGKSGVKLSVYFGEYWPGTYVLKGSKEQRGHFTFDKALTEEGTYAPIVTGIAGTAFVDLRRGMEQNPLNKSEWSEAEINFHKLNRLIWRSITDSPPHLADLRFSCSVTAYKEVDGERIELARHRQPYRITHVAEIMGTAIPATTESRGVEVWSRRRDTTRRHQIVTKLVHRRDYAPSVDPAPCALVDVRKLDSELTDPVELLPSDVVRLGRFDQVKVRFLYDEPDSRWLLTANHEVLEEQKLRWGQFMIYPISRPTQDAGLAPEIAGFGANAIVTIAVSVGTGLLIAEPSQIGKVVLIVIATGTVGSKVGTAVEKHTREAIIGEEPTVKWHVLRCDFHSTVAVDVGVETARVYVLSGGGNIELLGTDESAKVNGGEVLNVGGPKHFHVESFDAEKLPPHLKSGLLTLAGEEKPATDTDPAGTNGAFPVVSVLVVGTLSLLVVGFVLLRRVSKKHANS